MNIADYTIQVIDEGIATQINLISDGKVIGGYLIPRYDRTKEEHDTFVNTLIEVMKSYNP